VLAVAVHRDRQDLVWELAARVVVVEEQLGVGNGVREVAGLALLVAVGDVEAVGEAGHRSKLARAGLVAVQGERGVLGQAPGVGAPRLNIRLNGSTSVSP